MSDLLVAAEGAGASFGELRSIAARSSVANNRDDGRNLGEEFCAVNDLEVAAAAAASFQQETISSSEEESSSDESSSSESSSDEESSSLSDDDDVVHVNDVINMIDNDGDDEIIVNGGVRRNLAKDVQKGAEEFVKLELMVESDENARVKLHFIEGKPMGAQADVREIDMSDEDDIENCVEGGSSVKEAKATSREELMKEVNDLMEKIPDEAPKNNDFILPKLNKMDSNIAISTTDKLDLAGAISSVVEGMIVVKAKFMSRPLEIGSLLALECRTPLGRVQEIFGPVENPFYILQLLQDDLKDRIQPNAQVFSVEKHSQYIIPIMLKQGQQKRDADGDDGTDDNDDDDDDDEAIKADLQQDVPPLVGGHAFLEERRKRRIKRSSAASMPAKKFQMARNSTETKNVRRNGAGNRGQGNSHAPPVDHRGDGPTPHQLPPQRFAPQGGHSSQHISGNQNGPPPSWGPPSNQWCPHPNQPPPPRPELPFNQANHRDRSGGPPPPNFPPNPPHWGGPPPPNTWATPPAPSFNRRMAGGNPCPPPPNQGGNCGPNGGGPYQFGMQGQMPQGDYFNTGPPGSHCNGGMYSQPGQGGWGGPPPQGNSGMMWQNGPGNSWGGPDQQVRPNFGSRPFRGNRGQGSDQRGRRDWSEFGSNTPPGLQ
ncbi:hypothetical protein BSKO_13645 [Bryopsis sp. KO-2023]|nr:hypothetical protein BSKO_13645 [Bryopsis sp. KO-2023]